MKSSNAALRRRGFASEADRIALSELPLSELISKLHDAEPSIRSAAAVNMSTFVNIAVDELLSQLSVEKSLYTRLAICDALEAGNPDTARRMTAYLGKIGDNQHNLMPGKTSAKISFPLPRDIIARSLARMDIQVFPVLMEVARNGLREQISEVLDSIGYMAFYHSALATADNGRRIVSLSDQYASDAVILWKVIMCLSAFLCEESKELLLSYVNQDTTLGEEARRSLRILESRNAGL